MRLKLSLSYVGQVLIGLWANASVNRRYAHGEQAPQALRKLACTSVPPQCYRWDCVLTGCYPLETVAWLACHTHNQLGQLPFPLRSQVHPRELREPLFLLQD